MRLALALTFVVCTLGLQAAAAQQIPVSEAARELLRPDVRGKVLMEDTLSQFRTRRVPGGRVDVSNGVYRARYRVSERVSQGLISSDAAFEHVTRAARAYGTEHADEHLDVESVIEGRYASHVHLRQTLEGIPVYGRGIKVSLDKSRQPTMVINGYEPHLEHVDQFDPTPVISASQARRIVQTASTRGLDTAEPQLVVYPSKPPRLAWHAKAVMPHLAVEYDVLVDATTGEIIRMVDVTLHAHRTVDMQRLDDPAPRPAPPSKVESDPSGMPAADRPIAPLDAAGLQTKNRASEQSVVVDGSGWVFDPDPLSSAGLAYGGQYVDDNDADAEWLSEQLFEVPLRDISQGSDGLFRLEGPYVTIVGSSSPLYVPPAETSSDGFTYTRSNDFFEAVMAYYHIDKSQRYLQSLDVGFPIQEVPVRVNPQARSDDESNFTTSQNLIRFGTGAIDDAEDADVIWHEYAHALLYYTAPEVPITSDEGGAFHEGWSDYWAASYSRYLAEIDEQIPDHDWRKVFNWDGNNSAIGWYGRRLDHPGHYPDDTVYPNAGDIPPKYQEGMLWATTLMDIYPHVGREVLDRLNLASHAYLGSPFTFTDAAEALIQADLDFYAGAHSNILVHHLSERGYVDAGNYGPLVSHEPLPATEQTSGTVRIEVTAAATTAAIDSVIVYYGANGSTQQRLILEGQGGDLYAGDLPLPGTNATVAYYVEAVDVDGRRRSLPAAAPAETYAFEVGPDEEAPTIAHDPLPQISVAGWPIELYAAVEDNLGVDTVWVEYTIEATNGSVVEDSEFGLANEGGTYSGGFPTATPVEAGGAVNYRIRARDVSGNANQAVLPSDASFRVPFVEQGVLRIYDFEGVAQGLEPTGVWMRGTPAFGLRVAHSGTTVWATAPAGSYPDQAQRSTLDLPAVDLSDAENAHLIFWHWYDFEHDDATDPGVFDPNATFWDGGNVKVSTDGGSTWNPVEPVDGYDGTVSSNYDNPIGGEEAFGGYSYGWRREIVPLPSADTVSVRFDFGTDVSNEQESKYFAGWYIDDVTISTALPVDNEAPEALSLPDVRIVRIDDGEDPPSVTVEVRDDTGIEAVLAEYSFTQGDDQSSGSQRLAMAETDMGIYAGPIVPTGSFSAGDRIEYSILVRDFDGQEVRYGGPFVVDYRSAQTRQALTSVVSTGAWRAQGSGWSTSSESTEAVSSLVLEPFSMPTNIESAELLLEHSFTFAEGIGGNVKISDDDGSSWSVLSPAAGYPATLEGASPMAGEGVFADEMANGVSVFDLSGYAGSEVRIRLDMAAPRPLTAGEGWTIGSASYRMLSLDPEVQTDLVLRLNANFPDPVAGSTTISYTIPERMPARLAVYDMLGRRVAVIRHANHDPGTYTVSYNVDGLANGAYILHLETTAGSKTEQMVVAR